MESILQRSSVSHSVCLSVFWNRYKARSEPSKEIKFSKKHWNYIGFHLDNNLLCPSVSLSSECGSELEGNKSSKRRKTMRIKKLSESEIDTNIKTSCIFIKRLYVFFHVLIRFGVNFSMSICPFLETDIRLEMNFLRN